ncbi:MAG: toll/interleukin-1 receptor domain-containing protein [Clostridia bacterium]|nr:toll/interleukin-1 receptor domain-containing protein [Clostridia bacterium]
MGYAFISYSSKNQTSADAMRELFKKHNIDTWMAPYDIPAGSEYAEVLYDALTGCSCLVLMLTDVSQNSQWVKKEVNIAITNGKTVIPVKLEDVELNSSMKLYLNDQQIVPVHTIDERSVEIQKILNSVIGFTRKSVADTKIQSNATSPQSRNDRRVAPTTNYGDIDGINQYHGSYNPTAAGRYNNLGSFYFDRGEMKQAESCYLKAIEIYEFLAYENPTDYNAELALVYSNMGLFYKKQGAMQDAEKYYLKAIAIRRHLAQADPREYSSQLANTCYNAAIFYDCQGMLQEAEQYYLEALEIREKLVAENPVQHILDYANICNNLGNLYVRQTLPKRAEKYCLKALEIYEHLAEKNPKRYSEYLVIGCKNVSELYDCKGDKKKAEEYRLKAIEIRKRL